MRKPFDKLLAQHGFSALLTLTQHGRTHQILFDTGVTPDGVVENMRLFDLSAKAIETVILSHGHFDHTTGLELSKFTGRNAQFIALSKGASRFTRKEAEPKDTFIDLGK